MPRRGDAAAVQGVDGVELLGVIIVVDTDLDEAARRVGRLLALEDVPAFDDRIEIRGAHGVIGDRAADVARGRLARVACRERDE